VLIRKIYFPSPGGRGLRGGEANIGISEWTLTKDKHLEELRNYNENSK
jgi:hypothetical protein